MNIETESMMFTVNISPKKSHISSLCLRWEQFGFYFMMERERKVLTQRDLPGKGHAHQQQREADRHEFDDLVQRKLQLQVVDPLDPWAVLQEGIR